MKVGQHIYPTPLREPKLFGTTVWVMNVFYRQKGVPIMLKSGRWARKWDACLECGSSAEPHYAKGYCSRCYMRLYKRTQRRTQRAQTPIQMRSEQRRGLTL